jgi:acetyl-CoA acyltransferase 2
MADWSSYKSTRKVYLVDGRRTPFGKFGGSLMGQSPVDLAENCSKGLLEALKLDGSKIDHVVFSSVIPTTTDTLYAGRHLALRLGADQATPGYNVNRLCGSGFQAIVDAYNLILRDEAKCVLVAGAEAMSDAPHLLYGARFGTKYGAVPTGDLLLDSLTDKHCKTPMGITAENLAEKYDISREECERYSVDSHLKAVEAAKAGNYSEEIVPFAIRKGELGHDEHVRGDVTMEGMQKLRSSFKKDGTVTPATASGIVDGAASVIIADEKFVKENNLTPLAEIIDYKVVGVDPTIMGIGPVDAIRGVAERASINIEDVDLFEINEAFAAQVIACNRELKISPDKLNIWGGAVAIGHPLAATGVRCSLTLTKQMNKLGKATGIASACIGGGQGYAVYFKKP